MSKKRKDQSRYQPSTKNGSGSSGLKTAVVQQPERPPQEIISEAENPAQQDATQEDLELLTSPTSSDPGADNLDQWAKRKLRPPWRCWKSNVGEYRKRAVH